MKFTSFTCRGSVAVRWGGVADSNTLADFAASANVVGFVAPMQGLNIWVQSRMHAHAFFIYIHVYGIHDFHM